MSGIINTRVLAKVASWMPNLEATPGLKDCKETSAESVSCEVVPGVVPQQNTAPPTTLPALAPPGTSSKPTTQQPRLTGPALTGQQASAGVTNPAVTGADATTIATAADAVGQVYGPAASERVTVTTGTDEQILKTQTQVVLRDHLSRPPWSTAVHAIWEKSERVRAKWGTEAAFREHFAGRLVEANMAGGRRIPDGSFVMPELTGVGLVALARGLIEARLKAGKITPKQAKERFEFLTNMGFAVSGAEGRSRNETVNAAAAAATGIEVNARRMGLPPPVPIRFNRDESLAVASASDNASTTLYERTAETYSSMASAAANQSREEVRDVRAREANLVAATKQAAASDLRRQDNQRVVSADTRRALETMVRRAKLEVSAADGRPNLNRVG